MKTPKMSSKPSDSVANAEKLRKHKEAQKRKNELEKKKKEREKKKKEAVTFFL